MKGRITQDGSIVLPEGELTSMGITAGDVVNLVYVTQHPYKDLNSFGTFIITPPEEELEEDLFEELNEELNEELSHEDEMIIPNSLLEAASITVFDDLEISCEDGAIIIKRVNADPLLSVPPELVNLCVSLGIGETVIRNILKEGGI